MSKLEFTKQPGAITEAMAAQIALFLRLGVATVFIIGGWNKLSKLIDPDRQQALVDSYMGTAGYINSFFHDYLFYDGSWLSPWAFLTSLSSFELISGIMLLVGLFVRPLALLYGFLLWTFVFSLPVITTPGAEFSQKTYLAPAMFVQVRDITLSGIMFVLYNLGSGRHSFDQKLFGEGALKPYVAWENLGLLLRLSLAVMLLVAGFFHGMANIKTFSMPGLLLIAVGLAMLLEARAARIAGACLAAMMVVYMISKLNMDKSLIGNLNAIKREFAFLAAGLVLLLYGGGQMHTAPVYMERFRVAFSGKDRQA